MDFASVKNISLCFAQGRAVFTQVTLNKTICTDEMRGKMKVRPADLRYKKCTPSRHPIMDTWPFHKVYPPGTPLWPFGRFTWYIFRVPHYVHSAVSHGIPSGHTIMAIRLFHMAYPPGTPNGHSAVSHGIPSGHPIMAIRPFHKL